MATQADLDKLEAAIFTGTRRVKYQDKEVEYNSIDDMKKARNLLIMKLQTAKPLEITMVSPEYDGGFE